LFQMYVASVSSRFAKIYLDVAYVQWLIGYICMLQIYVLNVSSVSHVSCKCFISMLESRS
jgi:hypothetical protein